MKSISSKRFYICTPANICSGGPEALHQLAYYMHQLGMEAYTVYYDYTGFIETQTIDRYKQYKVSVIKYEDILDEEDSCVIASENAPWCLNGFRHAQRCIWWLGLIAADMNRGSLLERMAYHKRKLLGQSLLNYRHLGYNLNQVWHCCGSKYAYEYVRQRFPKTVVEYLVEPISTDFLRLGNADLSLDREDVVLYNPSKPSDLMSELLDRKRFEYIPLQGYTPQGLAEMYKKAKLYVDFGEFGGPERMPKEAVYFGCNILVSNHRAAVNDFDVAIPGKYKVGDDETAQQVEDRIEDMLLNYQSRHADFLSFKVKIEGLDNSFLTQLRNIFLK